MKLFNELVAYTRAASIYSNEQKAYLGVCIATRTEATVINLRK